ncbi:MAG: hypothetical protein JST00_46130 [Deltaproteobacteria bacterium]|nr:hypothetical protein [Deltaproteobacteria bacterium]
MRAGFEALAAFEPVARLTQKDRTLDGAVPLRVAQACVPLLEGNAFGRQIVFGKRLVVRSRLGRLSLASSPTFDEVDRAHRAAAPYLVAQGLLERGGPWAEQLTKRWWWTERGVLRVWTGLLVRPRPGRWLRVCGAGSRAILGLRVRTTWIGDRDDVPVPLVLDIEDALDGTRLEGEVATIASVFPDVRVELVSLDDARELAKAHAAFYDAKYFATKKGEVTKKYRRTIARTKHDDATPAARAFTRPAFGGSARVRVAHFAGPRPEIVRVDRVLGASSTAPVPAPRDGRSLELVRFKNAVPFRAHYDGNTLAIEPDQEDLARGARDVVAELAKALGPDVATDPASKGAVLYLTKYFTPHPHGEPHFFVKPWAFTATPPGWSTVIEGIAGKGYDVMRGVVWTDRFHATPAVFSVAPQQRLRVPAGVPLLDALAIPRAVQEEGVTMIEVKG